MLPAAHDIPSTHLTLLAGVLGGDAEAWARFFLRYRPVAVRWCRQRGLDADAAEDVAQALMAAIPRRLGSYRPEAGGRPQPFRAWLKAVVSNLAADHHRARARRPGDFGAGGDDPLAALANLTAADADALADAVATEYGADVDRVVQAVRDRTRGGDTWAAFEGFVLAGRPAPAVAADLGTTANAVRVAAHRVNKWLAEEYRKLFPGEGGAA